MTPGQFYWSHDEEEVARVQPTESEECSLVSDN
jgi:hypothetical protein